MPKKMLVTGGAGFIGINIAEHFLKKGWSVTILDNLSRKGSKMNLSWIREGFPGVRFIRADTRRDQSRLNAAVKGMDAVIHLAGQVAVTTSVTDPRDDFLTNAFGTFNTLEAVRLHAPGAIVLYSSTNKVYGGMEDIKIVKKKDRYAYSGLPNGIPESRLLDFHSPYGCSKGTADQYIHDYSRIYGMKTVVFRQSCIYGYRQFGIEDQGWVAWFIIAALTGKPIIIYGDGKQVRDVLFIEDLVRAYEMAIDNPRTYGKIYNIGGGPKFTMSLLQLIAMLEKRMGRKLELRFSDWRPGDQPVYISDIKKAGKEFGWFPMISAERGVDRLITWVKDNISLFR